MLNMKEVDYAEYCNKCVFRNLSESEDPCWDCLSQPVNEGSQKPVRYKEDERSVQNERNGKGRIKKQNKRSKR